MLDPFAKLPAEVTHLILDDLCSRDIATLRLATSAYRQLPNILFRRLCAEDMPWFWEFGEVPATDNVDWYSWYCMIKGSDLKGLSNRRRIWHDVEELIRRIQSLRESGEM